MVDDTQKQIRLTLWDKHAEDFDSSEHPVTAFKGLRVNDFNGRSLSLSASGLVRVNPDIPECAKLKQWYKLAGSNASYSSFSNQGNASLGQKSNTKITLGKAKEDGLGASDTVNIFLSPSCNCLLLTSILGRLFFSTSYHRIYQTGKPSLSSLP